jgi:hypothetical protein
VKSGGGVGLTAAATAETLALAVGTAGGLGIAATGEVPIAGSLAGAGSAAVNTAADVVEATVTHTNPGFVTRVTTAGGGSVDLTATDAVIFTALAGAGAGAGGGGQYVGVSPTLGFSLATNVVQDTVQALIDGATVISTGGVNLSAQATSATPALVSERPVLTPAPFAAGIADLANPIVTELLDVMREQTRRGILAATAAGGGAIGGGAVAGLGAISLNTVNDVVTAQIADGSQVSSGAGQAVALKAVDETSVMALAGAGGGAGAGGVGGGIAGAGGAGGAARADNVIDNTTGANIDSSTVHSGGDVHLDASSQAQAVAAAVGLSGAMAPGYIASLALSGALSAATNTMTNTVDASITQSSFAGSTDVTTAPGGNLILSAADNATVLALAGSGDLVAAGAVAALSPAGGAGIAIAANSVTDTVRAMIEQSTIVAGIDPSGTALPGNVELDATDNTVEGALALGIAGAITLSPGSYAIPGAGSIADNTLVNSVQAPISASSVHAAGAVTLNATDNKLVGAVAGAAALSSPSAAALCPPR